jgi:hypothetical protein
LQYIELIDLLDWLISGGPDDVFDLSNHQFLLVEAKQELIVDGHITLCVPKAVGQALAWATMTRSIMCPLVKCGY